MDANSRTGCSQPPTWPRNHVRSVFVSDLHLGSRHARPEAVLRFLRQCHPQRLYLVGDIIDARALARRWHWPAACADVLDHLAVMADAGIELFYTPGNHDHYLRQHLTSEPPVRIQDQFIHTCEDGRRLLILHGDQFDEVEEKALWLSRLGSISYDVLMTADRTFNRGWQRIGRKPLRISRLAKTTAKKCVQWMSGFESRVLAAAREQDCDGIVCGHIHVPRFHDGPDNLYVNLGDWVENATALVEYSGGQLELLNLDRVADFAPAYSLPVARPRRRHRVVTHLIDPLSEHAVPAM